VDLSEFEKTGKDSSSSKRINKTLILLRAYYHFNEAYRKVPAWMFWVRAKIKKWMKRIEDELLG